jgi:hypothetical protein
VTNFVTQTSKDGRKYFNTSDGEHKQLLIYWYQGRGRSVASEYWGKVYTVFDSVRMRRSDGAKVRLTTSIPDSKPAARFHSRLT